MLSVIGRDEEFGAIGAFLGEVAQAPAALVLSGEPGIGKTLLWKAGLEEARRRFGCVLAHQSVEAEASLSFAGLSDLVAPVFDEVAPLLAAVPRRSLEVALLRAEPGGKAPDPRAIGLALLDVLRLLAESRPLVVGLDDVQWLDSASAQVVFIALRRLADERVGLLATLRKQPSLSAPFEVERAFEVERVTSVTLAPLSLTALHRLLKERLALELTRPELGRVAHTSRGNPFFALELSRELVRTNTRPVAGRVLRVPDSLDELLGRRLARLPPETLEVLLSVAALARPTADLIAAAHERGQDALEALDAAAAEGVVEFDDSWVRFVHPLLASVCFQRASPWKRRAIHRALAGAVTDVEERARHLALATEAPDATVAASLDAAAEHAAARGATAAAAELFELAAELTPGNLAFARERCLRAATFHRLAGDAERAAVMLERLVHETPSSVERADVLFELALTRTVGPQRMIELLGEALAEAASDGFRSARILAYRSWIHMFEPDVRGALADARAALEKAEPLGRPALLAMVIAQVGQAEVWAGEITPGLLERGAEIEEGLDVQLEFPQSPRIALARLLTRMGTLDEARVILKDVAVKAAVRGDERTRGHVLWCLSRLEWLAGRWRLALEYAGEAHELAEQTQDSHTREFAEREKALIAADLGLADQARASAEQALAVSQASSDEFFTLAHLATLGHLELTLGNVEAAARYLRELPARRLMLGLGDPVDSVWGDAIETLIALGEFEQGRAFLEQYELQAERFGSPWAVAAAARCRGLLATAEGDSQAAFASFARALAKLEELPYPFERGRTLLCLGSAHRRAKHKRSAREALERALAILEELEARPWAHKASAEIARISGRRPATHELTEMEERVAELAAEGKSSKEIASALFVSVHTVSAHLSRVYQKLGVRSRAELAVGLSKPPTNAVKTGSDAAKPTNSAAKE